MRRVASLSFAPAVLVGAVVALVPAAAHAQADPPKPLKVVTSDTIVIGPPQPGDAGYRPPLFAAQPITLYLNRCTGGCRISPGSRTEDSALNDISSIAEINANIPEFSFDQATWDTVVACVRDTYLPYDVTVVTEPPTAPHVEMIVAGRSQDIGLTRGNGTLLGIAPTAGNCALGGNWIAYTFAAAHSDVRDPLPQALCATISHEAGHVLGLEHINNCDDPMTYREGCGQKFFRNVNYSCADLNAAGIFVEMPCKCGIPLATHRRLITNVGPGSVTIPPPTVTIVSPAPGPVNGGFGMQVTAVDRRGLNSLEIKVNGWSWVMLPGQFNRTTPYAINLPAELPPGVMDLEAIACGDTGSCATATVTVTEGAACTNADTCLAGQRCDEGRCLWDPPTLDIGATCTYDQACLSLTCEDLGDGGICTQACQGGPNDTCPEGFVCSAGVGQDGFCMSDEPTDEGGCCQTGAGSRGPLLALGLGGAVALLLGRRRRR